MNLSVEVESIEVQLEPDKVRAQKVKLREANHHSHSGGSGAPPDIISIEDTATDR